MRSQLLTTVLLCLGAVRAAPTRLTERDIDAGTFATLTFIEQFAAASYCGDNSNSPGTKLLCTVAGKEDSCPLVEADDTNTLAEFANTFRTDTTGYVAVDKTKKITVVAFRGSESIRNWIANLNVGPVDTDICDGCTAHSGFWAAWKDARKTVMGAIKSAAAANPSYKLYITGHSLGAAIATLAAAELRKSGTAATLVTFGQPRIGGTALSDFITNQGDNYRVTHYNDIVPRLPPESFGYVHISPEYFINKGNNQTVTAKDMKVVTGNKPRAGNGQYALPATEAHRWYFNNIAACSAGFEG